MDNTGIAVLIGALILLALTFLMGFTMMAGSFVMVGAFFRRILKLAETAASNPALALETETAQVVSKWRQLSGSNHGKSDSFQHHVRFRLADDDEALEFQVTEAVYQAVQEGELGVLTHEDSLFHSFVPARHDSPASAPPRSDRWICAHCRSQVNARETKCPSCGSATADTSVRRH